MGAHTHAELPSALHPATPTHTPRPFDLTLPPHLSGHVVVRAPRRVLLSTESARLDPALTRAVSAGAALSDRQLLALHLLHEASRGSQSAWWPYLATLPSHYAVLAAFSAEAAAQLQARAAPCTASQRPHSTLGPSVQAEHACNAAERVREAAAAEWRGAGAALLALALPLKFRGLRAWQWAAGCIATRTMHVPFDDVGCLTPFGDLHNFQPPPPPTPPPLPGDAAYSAAANDAARPWPRRGVSSCRVAVRRKPSTCGGAAAVHRTQARCTPGNGCDRLEASDEGVTGDGALQGDEYCVCTRVAVAAGEQVFLCYGRYSNLELLEHYGFLFNRNAHDRVHLAPDRFPPEARLIQSDAWLHTGRSGSWWGCGCKIWRAACTSPAHRAHLQTGSHLGRC